MDQPRQVLGRQPLAQVGGQQQLLLTVTTDEVLGHAVMVLNPSDGPPLCNSHRAKRKQIAPLLNAAH